MEPLLPRAMKAVKQTVGLADASSSVPFRSRLVIASSSHGEFAQDCGSISPISGARRRLLAGVEFIPSR